MARETWSVSKTFLFLLGICNFVIGLAVFLSVHLKFGFPVSAAIGVAVLVAVILYVVVLIDTRYQYHRLILWPIRRTFLFWTSSVVIDQWNVYVDIDSNGNAEIINEFWGKINFGYNRWITLGFMTDGEQPRDPDFPIKITNKLNDEEVEPDFVIDESKYKRLRIHFDHELQRGDRFHYEVAYGLRETFFFGREDHYGQYAYHNEKRIRLDVRFPENVVVTRVSGHITTEHGDQWEKYNRPDRITVGHILWEIQRAVQGNYHKLSWTTRERVSAEES